MPVKISKPAINLREELASLRNQGGLPKEDKLYVGDFIQNGDFSNGLSGWTDYSEGQGSATISNGKVVLYNYNSNANNEGIIAQKLTLVKGKTYKLKVDVSGQHVIINLGTSAMNNSYYQSPNTNSNFTTTFEAQADEVWLTLRNYNSGGNAEVDNVSVQEVGENLVTNGTFDTGTTGWIQNVGTLGHSNGRLTVTGDGTIGRVNLSTAIPITVGKTYTVTLDVVGNANEHFVHLGYQTGSANILNNFTKTSGTGTYSHTFTAEQNTLCIQLGSLLSITSEYDNITVTEGNHHIIQSIPHGYDVKDVYIDGELAREGEAYDYQVQTDGINQWLKPTVEPTATTETVVIGVRK